ncbi:hypothetical protein SteCoe_14007 [Stentor coeruleus]|uniref:START domain-containing protein n=1 Tax=Stentor coeruleus TaxID=5963 RepID=A0A1R2C747_9CILI|nr:hypothetical protein SteCoe_14007 [Stentor coeruleus]
MEKEVEGYMEKAEKAYEEAVSMLGDMSSWEVYENSQELVAYKRNSDSGVDILKVEFFIPRCPEKVIDFMYTNLADIYIRLNPDFICEYEIFKTYSDIQRIRYELADAKIPGVQPREILYFGVKLQVNDEVFAIIDTSVEHPEKRVRADVIRADVKYALHFCEKLNGMCHVVALAYGDPKGTVPKAFVNMGLRRRVDFYKVFIKEILKNTT